MSLDCKDITDDENKCKRNVAKSPYPYNLQPLRNHLDIQSVTSPQQLMAALILVFH